MESGGETIDQPLKDINRRTKKENPWQGKKQKTHLLGASYSRIGEPRYLKKSQRVLDCATLLEFREYVDNGELKLSRANFCKVRLCPMCAWRRSKKVFAQVSQVMDEITKEDQYEFLFLGLSARNVPADELKQEITNLLKAFQRFTQRKQIKVTVLGFFRALEVTRNNDLKSDWYGTYHPHFHLVLMVPKGYFTNTRLYLSQREITDLWKESLRVDYSPIVHIESFKTGSAEQTARSVSEVAKYTVKDTDWLIMDEEEQIDEECTDKNVITLDKALENRRLIAFGGKLKEIHKRLNLGDPLDGDLVHTGDEEIRDDLNYVLVTYKWNVGLSNYFLSKKENPPKEEEDNS